MKKHLLALTEEERNELTSILKKGRCPAWLTKRAQSLLALDAGPNGPSWSDDQVVAAYGASKRSCENWRRQFKELGFSSLLKRVEPEEPRRARRLNGEAQAFLAKLACSDPPEGHSGWSLRLLAKNLVALEVVDSVSRETVRQELKKISLSLG